MSPHYVVTTSETSTDPESGMKATDYSITNRESKLKQTYSLTMNPPRTMRLEAAS